MQEILFPGDSYTSPPIEVTGMANVLPSLVFFWNICRIVYRDSVLARENRYSDEAWTQGSLDTLRSLEACGVKVHIEGMNHMDALNGPCVFIANHMSTLETFVLPCLIQPRMRVAYVIKDSLATYPWFGDVARARNPIIVGRTNPRQDLATVLEGGEERLKQGTSIIVFPQSTRSVTLNMDLFNSIGVKLARRAAVPVVPIALRSDAWGMSPIIKDIAKLHPEIPVNFTFGEPFMVEGNGKAEHARVCAFISEHLAKWHLPTTT